MSQKKIKIGFIGQGWIGKNYANDFEERGFAVVRYSLEPEYVGNKAKIKTCDIVFIAVPTPTTPEGHDTSIVWSAMRLVGEGKIAVIKSTISPGTTRAIQDKFKKIIVLHSPEFLSQLTAREETRNPARNIVGVPYKTKNFLKKADLVLSVLPKAPYSKICLSLESELIKYGKNILGFFRIIFTNLLHDLSVNFGADWNEIREAMSADPHNGHMYLNPLHKTGRGAGGACFIKDFAAFVEMYKEAVGDKHGVKVLESLEKKNLHLLVSTKKDLDIVHQVYGKHVHKKLK